MDILSIVFVCIIVIYWSNTFFKKIFEDIPLKNNKDQLELELEKKEVLNSKKTKRFQ